MRIATETVSGKVEIPGISLADGSVPATVPGSPNEACTPSPEDEDELVAAIAQIELGEYLTVDQLLASLPGAN